MIRNSKIETRNSLRTTSPRRKRGYHEVVDSRLRGNDLLGGFRFSNFDFRLSILILNPES
jgi:hypothetical protein